MTAVPRPDGGRSFIDLHCHTSASFDCLSAPSAVVRAAASRGLTHLAVTDHESIDGALEARDAARKHAPDLTVIVGEEVRTLEGDLIALYIERAVPRGLPVAETIAAVREQGGLIGVPHPFDRYRGSLLHALAGSLVESPVDWIEVHNARVMVGDGNTRAAAYAAKHGLPGVAVSDAHSVIEVGVAYTALDGDPGTPAGLLAALQTAEFVTGRASYYVRLITPVAKVVQRLRGHHRPVPTGGPL
jgi:predicted metal-dependent phosphoesterase TrpH